MNGTKSLGGAVAVVGILLLLSAGVDTTQTAQTCYEVDSEYENADSSGCVETTYSNPMGAMFFAALGVMGLDGGGFLAIVADDDESASSSSEWHSTLQQEVRQRQEERNE